MKIDKETYKTYIKTSAVGLEVALYIIIGCLAGYYIDKKFGFSPYGLIVGLILGSIGAAKCLWIFAKKYLKNDEPTNNKRNK